MTRLKVVSMIAPFVAMAAIAGDYSIEVNKLPNFPEGIKTIAVLPIVSKGGIDPIWLEKCLLSEMSAVKTIAMIPAEKVKAAMFEMTIENLDAASMATIATRLNADAVLNLVITGAGKEPEGAGIASTTGGSMFYGSFEIAKAGLEMRIVNPQDGKLLLKGTGYGATDWKSQKGVFSTVMSKLVKKAFDISYAKPKPE